MAGAKYSPGFDDPAAGRRRGMRAALAIGAILGVVALGLTFLAYLNPSFAVEIGGFMALCAEWFSLR